MRLRALWIIKHGGAKIEVVYSRRFGNVENHARRLLQEDYTPVPQNDEIRVKMLSVLRLPSSQPRKYKEDRDTCEMFTSAPVYELCFEDGGNRRRTLPVVAIMKLDYILCCLPLAAIADSDRNHAPTVPFGTTAIVLDLLRSISSFLNDPSSSDTNSDDHMITELDAFLNAAIPLGRPIDTDPSVILDKMAANKATHAAIRSKAGLYRYVAVQPAWKPVLHKGKSQISLSIVEYVRSVQYDRVESPNMVDVYGSIRCTALLEGATSEVTLTIGHDDSTMKLGLQNVLFHPCLSAIDEHDSDYYKVRFMPGNACFVLCSYVVPRYLNIDADMPVCGVFKLRGDYKMADFWLQLKLSNRLKNSFEHFEATIPFFNRGKITHAELRPSWGMTTVSRDRRNVIWPLGYKFPSKTLDASLKGTVVFDKLGADVPDQRDPLAAFCVDLNCFAQISFRTKSYAYSSCNVDPKSVRVTPEALKHKFTVEKSFESADCKIWNSYGDVPKIIQLGVGESSTTHVAATLRGTSN